MFYGVGSVISVTFSTGAGVLNARLTNLSTELDKAVAHLQGVQRLENLFLLHFFFFVAKEEHKLKQAACLGTKLAFHLFWEQVWS